MECLPSLTIHAVWRSDKPYTEPIAIPVIVNKEEDVSHLLGQLGDYSSQPVTSDGSLLLSVITHSPADSGFDEDEEGEGIGCSCPIDSTSGPQCTSSSEDCECVSNFGNFYDSSNDSASSQVTSVLQLAAVPPDFPLRECSPLCSCSPARCSLRVSQLGVRVSLSIRKSETIGGAGLFAEQRIVKGTFVCLYSGEMIDAEEARRRRAEGMKDNYILSVRERSRRVHEGNFSTEVLTIIDARKTGNVGRFANHACPPAHNLILVPVRPVGSVHPLIGMFVRRDVESGEELRWDYGDGLEGSRSASDGEREHWRRTACLCGSERCRGWLPFGGDANAIC
ncbi:SET domain-containing protein [Atractiella rhizophila]|nr:SET domain-containing protein [Atractiella rhizophila]